MIVFVCLALILNLARLAGSGDCETDTLLCPSKPSYFGLWYVYVNKN